MALARPFESIVLLDFVHLPRHASSIPAAANPLPALNLSRRDVMLICTVPLNLVALSPASLARERRARNSIPIDEYNISAEGLKYYDLVEGRVQQLNRVRLSSCILQIVSLQVHFDCVYHGITAVSSRESKLLAGNRVIAQRTVIVPPQLGYGEKGMNEIPPGATFVLNLELLDVMQQK
ncbi:hypothetical protein HPP92_015207 [Vanilla planifolia]|uniref:peptidylprolyl isomerase n=1 Tax=Vanilla planifolia TaxID=51239 RepID=A0A835UUV9_VANPL|nr:hypothetical protein HPP92_015207 [Vanilla planifolia]